MFNFFKSDLPAQVIFYKISGHNNKFNAMIQACIDMLEDGRVERPYTSEAITELKKLL